ncbi:C2 family cysteine protease [Streptomyces sp. NPDC048370]|uniref:C2 family cysteine protease n=1 Tax=Streptomyces sp. NPDC048370 TaxID=3365540 RepID=UPI003711FAB0
MSELGTAERGTETKAPETPPLPDAAFEAPDAGEEPVEPGEPDEPGEPEGPGEPERPADPEEPDAPEEPEAQGEPAEPEADADPADNGRDTAEAGPEPERAFLGDVFSKLRDTVAGLREPADGPVDRYTTVDRPDFNAMEIPEVGVTLFEYGTPLDRPDGQRAPLFDGELRREQTEQGRLGDCGVIATMGAVASHLPEAISECVKENEDGTYEVTLHQVTKSYSADWTRCEPNGAVTVLTVTPELVVQYDRPDKPAYARAGAEDVAWPAVLEKAFAGVDQTWEGDRPGQASGYERLDLGTRAGHRAEMLTQLTGRPAYTDDIPTGFDMNGVSPERQLLTMFREKLDAGCPILIGTRKIEKDERPLPNNLVDGHVYEVTRVDDRGLIHLHNPHNINDPKPLTAKELRANFSGQFTTMG